MAVVVPTLNEEASVEGALRSARRALGPHADLVVADGGSSDATRRLAAARARVVRAPPGRGGQLNAGARAADGADVLLFLHADTRLSPGAGLAIRRALRDPAVAGGCLRFAVDPPAAGSLRYRLLETGVNLRTRLFRTATGDQAIFVRRSAFEAVGGFPDEPLFEDVGLVRRLRRQGRFRPVPAVARTSRRRWERRGFWRTVLTHWTLRAGHALGIPPRRLARWYGSSPAGERIRNR